MEGVGHEASPCGTERAQPPDVAIAALAARQYGVVSLTQLQSAGLTASGVRSRVARGRLHRIHRGVYAVGHTRLDENGCFIAAVLAYGPRALLSHRSAAALWGLHRDGRALIDVTVPGRSARSRRGVRAHRGGLRPQDAAVHEGVPCTSVARTLLDFAAVARPREVERAVSKADVLRLLDLRQVDAAPGHPGAGVLREALGAEPALTAGELEERFLAICERAALPRPEVNAELLVAGERLVVDFLWRDDGLVIETDGYAFHSHRAAFESDRRRDQLLMLTGFQVLRFTWRQLTEEAGRVASTCTSVLADVSLRSGARRAPS
jgi:Transcriptional regulator, AbiEi antitoxin/Protein of unknown function (DUF559)